MACMSHVLHWQLLCAAGQAPGGPGGLWRKSLQVAFGHGERTDQLHPDIPVDDLGG